MDARAMRWYPSRMHIRLMSTLAAGVSLVLAGACGGKVIFEGQSSGAGGGGTGGSSSAGGSCDALLTSFAQALAAAEACDPKINATQCDGTAMVFDACGCPSLVNELNPAKVSAATTARQAAAAQGCFTPCGAPCQPFAGGFCEPIAGGATGKCAVAFPD
jgi:hypothetical protein